MGVVEYSGSSLNTHFYLSKFEPNANLWAVYYIKCWSRGGHVQCSDPPRECRLWLCAARPAGQDQDLRRSEFANRRYRDAAHQAIFLLAPVSDRSCRDALQRHTQRPTDLGLTRHSSRADHGRLDLTALCPDGQRAQAIWPEVIVVLWNEKARDTDVQLCLLSGEQRFWGISPVSSQKFRELGIPDPVAS
jgi:hypothetical protein